MLLPFFLLFLFRLEDVHLIHSAESLLSPGIPRDLIDFIFNGSGDHTLLPSCLLCTIIHQILYLDLPFSAMIVSRPISDRTRIIRIIFLVLFLAAYKRSSPIEITIHASPIPPSIANMYSYSTNKMITINIIGNSLIRSIDKHKAKVSFIFI